MVPILDIVKTPTLSELTRLAGRTILSTLRAGFQFVLLPFLSFALSFRLIQAFVDFVVVAYHLHYGHSTSLVSELARTGWVISDIGRSMYSFLNSSLIKAPGSLLPLGLRCLPFDNSTTYRVCTSAAFVDRIAGYARDVLAVPAWDELLILCIFSCISWASFHDIAIAAFREATGITAQQDANALQSLEFGVYRRLVRRTHEARGALAEARETGYDVFSGIHRVKALCEQGSAKKRSLAERIRAREQALSKTKGLLHELHRGVAAAKVSDALTEHLLRKARRERTQVLNPLLEECLALDGAEASAEFELCIYRATRHDEAACATRASTLRFNAQVDGYAHATKTFEEKIVLLRFEVANLLADIAQTKDTTLHMESAHGLVLADTTHRHYEVAARVDEKQIIVENFKKSNAAQAATNAALSQELSMLGSTFIQSRRTARTRFAALAATAGKDHLAAIDRMAALEGRRSQLLDTLLVVKENTAELNGSLEFSTVEHLLHMQHCATARPAAASQLTSLQSSLTRIATARAELEVDGVPLRAKKAEMEAAQKAGTAGLETRLTCVSEGFAGVASARGAAAKVVADARRALAQSQSRNRTALGAYQCARKVNDAFADGLIRTSREQKTRVPEVEALVLALDVKKVKSVSARPSAADLAEKMEFAQDVLADQYEALSARELCVARLHEEHAAIFDSEEALKAERCDDARTFTKGWKKARKANDAFRQRSVEQRLFHRGRMAAFEGRLEGAAGSLTDGPSFSPLSATALDGNNPWEMPEFVQGSSRSATPERNQYRFCRDGSYPSTPSLTPTSRSNSCSPFSSPVFSFPYASYVVADPAEEMEGVHPCK